MRLYQPAGPGTIYWLDFHVNGRRVRRSTGTRDRKAADEFAAKLKHDTWRAVRLGEPPPRTWDEAVLGWLESNQEMKSLESSKLILTWLTERLRGRLLRTITEDVLAEVMSQRAAWPKNRMLIVKAERAGRTPPAPLPPSASTVNKCMAHVSIILQYAKRRKWLRELPVIPTMREAQRRKPIQWISQEQFIRLLGELPEHLRPICIFTVATGLRESNVRLLRWSQIDLAARRCWFDVDQMKAGENHGVPLSDAAAVCLEQQRGKHPVWVFPVPHRRGEGKVVWDAPTGKVSNTAWYGALRRAGLVGLRFHALRHSWASWHVNAGTPEKVLQALGGWASREMVDRYAHLADTFTTSWANNGQAGFAPIAAPQLADFRHPSVSVDPPADAKCLNSLGWLTGLEPATTGITTRTSPENPKKIIYLQNFKTRKTR